MVSTNKHLEKAIAPRMFFYYHFSALWHSDRKMRNMLCAWLSYTAVCEYQLVSEWFSTMRYQQYLFMNQSQHKLKFCWQMDRQTDQVTYRDHCSSKFGVRFDIYFKIIFLPNTFLRGPEGWTCSKIFQKLVGRKSRYKFWALIKTQ